MSPPTARTSSDLVNVLFMWIETPIGEISCWGAYMTTLPRC